jgi:hypothetical protein
MTALGLVVAALAAWQAVEVWHHGSVFDRARARLELKTGFWVDLLQCPFCLSVWVGMVTVLTVHPGDTVPPLVDLGWVSRALSWVVSQFILLLWWVVHGLAVARLANLGNDLTHHWCRTPRPGAEIEDPPHARPDDPFTPGPPPV